MPCRDCRNGTHVRSEVGVLVQDTVTLRRHVCVCGLCPEACPARPVAVETAERWHHQHRHRDGDGAMLAAPAEVWAARAAAARAVNRSGRHTRQGAPGLPAAVAGRAQARAAICAAVARPGRHRAPIAHNESFSRERIWC
jgi:hypothetical protein